MNDVEKCSAVLENAAGFVRLDAYVYDPVTKWRHWGMFIHIEETNFPFSRTPYKSKCHQRWVPRGSDTSACPRVWLGPVAVLCQVLEARKNLVGGIRKRTRRRRIWNGVTATVTLFPHMKSSLHLGAFLHFAPWNKPIHGLELFQFATVLPILSTR